MRWLVRAIIAAVLLGILGGAYYWFFGDGDPPTGLTPFALDMNQLREMSDDIAGDLPTEVRVERIASFSFPAVAAVGGDGWNFDTMGAYSYQVILPTGTIVIDSGLNAQQGAGLGAKIDDDAYSRMELALAGASQIIVTHEHTDHLGGIMSYDDPAVLVKALRLTPEQLAAAPNYGMTVPAEFAQATPLAYDTAQAIAPGVVLWKAPGHTPGSQLVFVKLASGKELLFIGDIGWTLRNVETGKGRPRVLSQFMLNEDRNAVFAELETLKALHAAEPELNIVPGHDSHAIDALVDTGVLTREFRP